MHLISYAAYSAVRHGHRQYAAAERARQEANYQASRTPTPTPPARTYTGHNPSDAQVIDVLTRRLYTTRKNRDRAFLEDQIEHIKAGRFYTTRGNVDALFARNFKVITPGLTAPRPRN